MNQLIPATPNRRPDSKCLICLEGFDAANPGWTHLVNGAEADHDPMHKRCLSRMFNAGRYRCLHDQILLDPHFLPAQKQLASQKAQQLMTNFVCAAFLGTGIAIAGVATTAVAEEGVAVTVASLAAVVIAARGLGPQIVNDLGITKDDQITICAGINIGLLTMLTTHDYNVQTILATMSLASGFFSGMITMMHW